MGLRWKRRVALCAAGLALAGVCAAQTPRSSDGVPDAPVPTHPPKPNELPERLAEKPSLVPAFSIPVEPLGFSSPGAFYLGLRVSMVSLDFVDENRLLFTFRVPGLIHRDPEGGDGSKERQIRALVLTLPTGTVESEGLWTVHDWKRYLWMQKDGRFLLRDRESLQLGDSSLELKPFLHFAGPLVWVEMDPEQQYLVTESRETAAAKPGDVPSPAGAAVGLTVDGEKAEGKPDLAVRILRRDNGQVMLISHTRSTVHLPVNSEGYLESLRGRGASWFLSLKHFTGGSTILGQVESVCGPQLEFISQREVLAGICSPQGYRALAGITTAGRLLWQDETSPAAVWALAVMAPGGLRMAREALAVPRAVNARAPLDQSDVKGQLVEVLDAADGKLVLETQASPVLDAGGNVAISPSGRRVAVLNAGAIQVFELPPPAPLPDVDAAH